MINISIGSGKAALEKLVNEEFHPAKSGYLNSHHCSDLYMLHKQNKFVIHSNTS